MRPREDWMVPADDLILEYLADNQAGTPKAMADEFDKNNDYIGVRCRILADNGYVERVARGLYRITDQGRSYLDGDLEED